MPPVDLERLEKLAREATPGPWAAAQANGDARVCRPNQSYIIVGDALYHPEWWADAQLIAVMRNALPSLLTELHAARKVAEAARLAVANYRALPDRSWPTPLLATRAALDEYAKVREGGQG